MTGQSYKRLIAGFSEDRRLTGFYGYAMKQ